MNYSIGTNATPKVQTKLIHNTARVVDLLRKQENFTLNQFLKVLDGFL